MCPESNFVSMCHNSFFMPSPDIMQGGRVFAQTELLSCPIRLDARVSKKTAFLCNSNQAYSLLARMLLMHRLDLSDDSEKFILRLKIAASVIERASSCA
jgi:hypothetical protein